MNSNYHNLCILFFFLISVNDLFAQDRIYFRDRTVAIDVQVDTIKGNEVFYFEKEEGEKVRKRSLTYQVKRIVYADGTHQDFKELYKDKLLYANQLKQGLKINLLSPLLGHTQFSYERNISPGLAMEYSLGIIGLGNNFDEGFINNFPSSDELVKHDQSGFYLGAGAKFYTKPLVRSMGQRYKHLLEGWYFMPKLLVGYYEKNTLQRVDFMQELKRDKIAFGSLMFYGGKQIVLRGSIVLSGQIGIGFSYDNFDGNEEPYHYVISMTTDVFAIGGGISIGFLF